MFSHIAILRGINVGGHRKILMAELRTLLKSNGFQEVTTYIQSGNVLLSSNLSAKEIEIQLVELIHFHFGFEVPVMVRTVSYWKEVIENNPFLLESPELDVKRLHVTFLSAKADEQLTNNFNQIHFSDDSFKVVEDRIYLLTPERYSDSKLTNDLFEKKLKLKATTRNWKTVTKLFQISNDA